MDTKRLVEKDPALKKDDLIVITGAGGFIGGNLALYFKKKGISTNVNKYRTPVHLAHLAQPPWESNSLFNLRIRTIFFNEFNICIVLDKVKCLFLN